MQTPDLLAGIDDLPWDRIVHVYGRASDIPALIRRLGTKDHAAAEEQLLHWLEHQDSLSQATPFAVCFIVHMLNAGRVKKPAAVRRLLKHVHDAAQFQIDAHGKPRVALDWYSLLSEERLWPKFKSKRDDEIYWEEWNPPEEEWVGWAVLTDQLIREGLQHNVCDEF